jgi:hypothetical protein
MKIPLHLAVDSLAYLDFIPAKFLEQFSHPGIIFVRSGGAILAALPQARR